MKTMLKKATDEAWRRSASPDPRWVKAGINGYGERSDRWYNMSLADGTLRPYYAEGDKRGKKSLLSKIFTFLSPDFYLYRGLGGL